MSLNNLSKPQLAVLAAVALFVVIEIFLFATGYLNFNKDAMNGNQDDPDTNNEISTTTDVEIPDMSNEVDENATSTKADTEVEIVDESGQGTGSKLGMFRVTASNDGFSPSEIVVTQGDVLETRLTAESSFDFYIPAYGVHVSPGNQVSFNASATGTFRIECRDSCPSSGKILGQLMVKPKQ